MAAHGIRPLVLMLSILHVIQTAASLAQACTRLGGQRCKARWALHSQLILDAHCFITQADVYRHVVRACSTPHRFSCASATAATVVSGSVAERVKIVAYVLLSLCITLFIYPVVSCGVRHYCVSLLPAMMLF